MSLVTFKDLPKDLTRLLSHTLMLPFWYVAIYIFHPKLYASNDIILIVALTICLAISSATLTTSIIVLASRPKKYILDKSIVYPSIYFEIISLSLVLMFSYISKLEFDCTFEFYGFVLANFIPKLFILYFLDNRRLKRDKK